MGLRQHAQHPRRNALVFVASASLEARARQEAARLTAMAIHSNNNNNINNNNNNNSKTNNNINSNNNNNNNNNSKLPVSSSPPSSPLAPLLCC